MQILFEVPYKSEKWHWCKISSVYCFLIGLTSLSYWGIILFPDNKRKSLCSCTWMLRYLNHCMFPRQRQLTLNFWKHGWKKPRTEFKSHLRECWYLIKACLSGFSFCPCGCKETNKDELFWARRGRSVVHLYFWHHIPVEGRLYVWMIWKCGTAV